MTFQLLINDTDNILSLDRHTYSSAHWLSYFQSNKSVSADRNLQNVVAPSSELCAPLVRSLQRFQIGESGDGTHLKKYASEIKDSVYEECIDLFVKEEQGHALILAEVIKSMNGALLISHWSALTFRALRRMMGLKTEVFILLIAEVIGKCFYKACADNVDDRGLRAAFSQIVTDEIFHLEFHTSFMRQQMSTYSQLARQAVFYCWTALFYAAFMVFIVDHRQALKALDVSPKTFMQDCSSTFNRAAVRVLV